MENVKCATDAQIKNDFSSRCHYIDIMRIFACCLVVLTHCQLENVAENGFYVSAINFFCSPSSELFLALSGAVLLPVVKPMREFYNRRFLKLLPPLVFWSILWLLLKYLSGELSSSEALSRLVFIPLKPAMGVYWFMYVMVGLYLFAPIISCWLVRTTKRQIEFYLIVWLVTTFIPLINIVVPDFYNQDGSYYWVLCYFGGFLGYWILGYYLRTYPIRLKSVMGVITVIACLLYFCSYLCLKLLGIEAPGFTDNLQWGSVAFVTLYFIVIRRLSTTALFERFVNERASKLATYSFGVYLIHMFILVFCVKPIFRMMRMMDHPVIEAFVIMTITILVCFCIIKVLSLCKPLGKWLFGLK